MSSILSSPAVVLATAMAVSGALLLLSGLRHDNNSSSTSNQGPRLTKRILRSCLSSDGRRREKRKKTVKFAESVKDQVGDGERYRKEKRRLKSSRSSSTRGICRSDMISRMPENRIALYNGILRDRGQRVECLSC